MRRRSGLPLVAGLSLAAVVAASCTGKIDGGDDRDLVPSTGGTGTGGNGTGGTTSETGGTSPINVNAGADGSAASGGTGGSLTIDPSQGQAGDSSGGMSGDGTPETCDGIDNDDNGIIDDVDAGHDGVCDCLNIGTIGRIGPWSDGGDIFADWLNARSPQGAVALGDSVLTADSLAPLQIVVLLHVATTEIDTELEGRPITPSHHPFSDAEIKVFKDWVTHGGGVMSTIGYTWDETTEAANVNLLLGSVGMGYSATKIELNGFVTEWTEHPVTHGVSNISTVVGIEPDGADATTLARGEGDRVALQVTEAGDGRVVAWGDEWITYDSEWADVDDQQVELFWLNMLKWLSPPKNCQVPIPPALVK